MSCRPDGRGRTQLRRTDRNAAIFMRNLLGIRVEITVLNFVERFPFELNSFKAANRKLQPYRPPRASINSDWMLDGHLKNAILSKLTKALAIWRIVRRILIKLNKKFIFYETVPLAMCLITHVSLLRSVGDSEHQKPPIIKPERTA
ncbi:hypothetical protein EVAR_101894_1 [Eumeta japonica]|uniref:Uncharacterized protein n=1 Tax=Eumeta variegata TaxID=151549 RepID=A0A4C1SNV6_EUMVA|nr:hypothetical protein EVAR_101894_1 [Eumeta japonica]